MRITKLKLSNLNSLKGKFEIDFTDKELIEDNIFAIVGDTGSGKSSILDAITLALFAKTARIEKITGSSNEIMNRDSGDCYSEVFFSNCNCEYSALFSQRKARNKKDGNLLMYTRTLRDITNDKQLTSNKDFDTVLEGLINLTFDQFSRSVLLAQGDFNMFLIAKDDDKAKILEQITGTEIYSKIGKKIYEHYSFENKALELINERLKSQDILSDEEKKEIEQSISKNQKLIEESNKDRYAIDKILSYYGKKDSLELKRSSLTNDIKKRDSNSEQNNNYKEKLDLFEKAKEPYQLSNKLNIDSTKLEIISTEILELNSKITTLDNLIESKNKQVTITNDSITKKEQEKLELNKIIAKVRPIDLNISHDGRDFSYSETQYNKSVEEINGLKLSNDTFLVRINDIKSSIEISNEYLKAHKSHKILSEKYDEFITNNNLLKSNVHYLEDSKNAIIKYDRELNLLDQNKAKFDKELQEVDEIINSINREISKNKSNIELKVSFDLCNKKNVTLNRLEDVLNQYKKDRLLLDTFEKELCNKEIERESNRVNLVEQKKLLDKANLAIERGKELLKLSAFAHNVVEGEACPLCGSLNHPQPLSVKEDNLIKEEQELATINTKFEALTNENIDLKSKIDTIEDNIKRLKSSVVTNKEILVNSLKVQSLFDETFNILREENERNIEHLNKEISNLEAKEKLVNTHSINKVKYEERLLSINKSINDTINGKKDSLTKNKQYEIEISNLNEFFIPYKEFKNISNSILNNYKIIFDRHVNSIDKKSVEIKSLENTIITNNQSIDKKNIELSQLSESMKVIQMRLESNKTLRKDLFSDKDCDNELLLLTKLIDDLNKNVAKILSELNTLVNNRVSIKATISVKSQNKAEIKETINLNKIDLNKLLKNNNFNSVDELKNSQLSVEQINNYNKFTTEFVALVAKINILEESIKEDECLLNNDIPDITKDEAILRKNEIENEYDLYQQLKGNYQEKIDNDKKNVAKLGQIKLEREKQIIIYDRWSKLNAAVGSSDGQKFRKLAQGITLDYLLNNANLKLNSLTDRYSLIRENTTTATLDISVIDLYMNGIERSVRNLSGGEKFLVSLSLALGLSELVNSKNPSETLFLDEGFGTLDEETLDHALNTLMILSEKEHKLIGIISHVEKVKDAISHKISVDRNGNGSSTINGPGVLVKDDI
ncbi:MAG: AAA family ATPase [Spirochaetaceae bacterium]|nr:AAA family ATPase [Spirochaetaceae bacterium]